MGAANIIGIICEKIRGIFAPEIFTEETRRQVKWEDLTASQRYVNLLLLDMFKKGEREMTLTEGEILQMGFDGFDDSDLEGVTYAGVRDRLREMVTSGDSNDKQCIDLVLVGKPMVCQIIVGDNSVGLTLREKV